MDLSYSPEEEAFRDEVRSWLDANLPQEWRHGGVGGFREEESVELQRGWQKRLYDGGWVAYGYV